MAGQPGVVDGDLGVEADQPLSSDAGRVVGLPDDRERVDLDEVARGLIEARSQQVRDVPMVVRIVGTNAAEAAELLEAARFVTAASLDEAAAKAVASARVAVG